MIALLHLVFFCYLAVEGKTICNPVDLSYRFVINSSETAHREAADPSMVFFKGEFYLFASRSGGYFHSTDMVSWDLIVSNEIDEEKYAPAAVVSTSSSGVDDAILWMTSESGNFHRSTDPKSGHWNLETNNFPQRETDPSLLWDDGRLYWYGGCSDSNPIYAVEINPKSYQQIGSRVTVISQHAKQLGWEVMGDTNQGSEKPWVEGSFPIRIGNRYYLEYAVPGTGFKSYCSAIYTSDQPLGPFTLQHENPLTIKEGGFACGAGHGSTFQDSFGNYWHISTVTISKRADFERRLQINPVFVDGDGALWGYTGFADWPKKVPTTKLSGPEDLDTGSVLLSYGKTANASSTLSGHAVGNAVDEDIRTWWSASDGSDGQWLQVDLGSVCNITGVQVNFADQDATLSGRSSSIYYRYVLEGSDDGTKYSLLHDYSTQMEDHPHQYTEVQAQARYIRITSVHTPSGKFSVSGLRVFGLSGSVARAAAPTGIKATRMSDRRGVTVSWTAVAGAAGYNVRFGTQTGKLYQNQIVYGKTQLDIRYLNSDLDYVFTVDAYNEAGITKGTEMARA